MKYFPPTPNKDYRKVKTIPCCDVSRATALSFFFPLSHVNSIWKEIILISLWLIQLKILFHVYPVEIFFFHFSEKWNIFRVFTQRPLTFLPVSCRIDVGHNDYGYQQPSYPEQGYDRPYEDSSQHYYEGGIYIPSHTYAHTFPFLPHPQREQKLAQHNLYPCKALVEY